MSSASATDSSAPKGNNLTFPWNEKYFGNIEANFWNISTLTFWSHPSQLFKSFIFFNQTLLQGTIKYPLWFGCGLCYPVSSRQHFDRAENFNLPVSGLHSHSSGLHTCHKSLENPNSKALHSGHLGSPGCKRQQQPAAGQTFPMAPLSQKSNPIS